VGRPGQAFGEWHVEPASILDRIDVGSVQPDATTNNPLACRSNCPGDAVWRQAATIALCQGRQTAGKTAMIKLITLHFVAVALGSGATLAVAYTWCM
jgi:hypothetical protein